MPDEQSISHGAVAGDTAAPAHEPAPARQPAYAQQTSPAQQPDYAPITEEDDYEPLADGEEDDWLEEPEQLPPRPRRRLLGAGVNPIPVALIGVLLIACGFIGGVLVQKGQTSSSGSTAASGLASRFAALRGSAAGGSTTGSSGASGGGAGGLAGRLGGLGGAGAASATIGEVSFVAGDTLYVTSSEGNTVKVITSPASSITKTVKSDVHGIHPGETVVVRGAKSSGGAVSAESVSVSAAGAAGGGGLSSLFGGGSSSGTGGGSGSGAGGGSGSGSKGGSSGNPSLFGG